MSKQILAPIFQQNVYGLYGCVPSKPISCDNAEVNGIEWFTPVLISGVLKGYKSSRGVKPQLDSVKTVRVQVNSSTFWIAIADDQNESDFLDACNACCEAGTPLMTLPTIPAILYEDVVCANDDGTFTYLAAVPVLATGQKIIPELFTCAGVALTPTALAGGHVSAAAFVTWATTNWSAYGTFAVSPDGNNVIWTAVAGCTAASLSFKLLTQSFCAGTLTFPKTVHSVVINGVTKVLPSDLVVADADDMIAAIASILGDGVVTKFSATQINYAGTGVPGVVKDDTDATIATFSLGACA